MLSRTYKYTILKFRPSLTGRQAVDIPIAVILLSADDKRIGVFGHHLKRPNGISDVSWNVLQRIREIISDQVLDAVKKEIFSQELFDVLARQNRWNLYITPVATYEASNSFDLVLYQLYLDHVAADKAEHSSRQKKIPVRQDNMFTIAAPA